MGDGDARIYYVLTLKGQQGPLDKQGVKELVVAGGARPEDQVRNAFGRNLGTVREVCGPIRLASHRPEAPTGASGRRTAVHASSDHPATDSGRSPAPHAATTSGRGVVRASARAAAEPVRPGRRRILLIILAAIALLGAVAATLLLMPSGSAQPVAPPEAQAVPSPKPVPTPAPGPAPAPAPMFRPLALPPPPAVQCAIATGRAVATAEYAVAGEVLGNLFDGSPASKWLAHRVPGKPDGAFAWVHVEPMPGGRRITGYALTAANDHSERDPSSWRLIGIAADGSEAPLDARSGESWSQRFERRVFKLPAAVEFPAYRLDILELHGQARGVVDAVQLAELELLSR